MGKQQQQEDPCVLCRTEDMERVKANYATISIISECQAGHKIEMVMKVSEFTFRDLNNPGQAIEAKRDEISRLLETIQKTYGGKPKLAKAPVEKPRTKTKTSRRTRVAEAIEITFDGKMIDKMIEDLF